MNQFQADYDISSIQTGDLIVIPAGARLYKMDSSYFSFDMACKEPTIAIFIGLRGDSVDAAANRIVHLGEYGKILIEKKELYVYRSEIQKLTEYNKPRKTKNG